jgi:integrase/recombinase XerD
MEKLFDVISEEDLVKIVQSTKYPKYKLAFMLGFYQCMRVSEIAKLRQEHVDKNLKLLYIKQAKGHKDRNIPIAPEVFTKLRYLPCGSDKAKDFGIRAIQYAFSLASKKALGKKLNSHLLRHSGITYYLTKKKWNTMQVQRLAGHSKSSITEIYTHINPEDLVERMWEK